ncbi:hypothetical protein [Achromobacter kerstersii]|jgi:hypothetical protein|uniref:hypothetical protein n=1 Tax=Achromobacter kerstersii TaxID=1353890 RepID=UPI0006C832A4|nr:hypothetical protein [Achromobacter kerstersii]
MTELSGQHIGAIAGLVFVLAFVVYISSAAYFYYFKLDDAIRLTSHPMANGRTRSQLTLYEKLAISTTLLIWLVLHKATFWPINNVHHIFGENDVRTIPSDIKIPLYLAYGGMAVSVLALLIGSALKRLYA